MLRNQMPQEIGAKTKAPRMLKSSVRGASRPSSASAGKVVITASGMTKVKKNFTPPRKKLEGQRAASKIEVNSRAGRPSPRGASPVWIRSASEYSRVSG